MRKIVSLALAVLLLGTMVFTVLSCKKDKNAGKLVCGVTEFEPMNYRDSGGKWTGFDTELALLVGQKLGLQVDFQEIEWAAKYQELEAGTINCIWNGFTANANEKDGTKRSDLVDFSYSYLLNQQCVVVKTERAGEFRSVDSLAGKTAAAESGSAGESFAKDAIGNGRIVGSPAQINTFMEVKSGAVDFAVIDILLAQKMAGKGDYTDLRIADIVLDNEVYAVGFKKGSDLRDKVNKALKELYDEGKMLELAKKYKLEDSLLLDTNFRG